MKILVVKTSSLGDIVHALPALTDAHRALPGLVVDWVVEPAFADIVRLHGGVRTLWTAPLRRWRRPARAATSWREAMALRRALRAERYDLVLDAQGLWKSALVARLAGGRIAGLDRASARGGPIAVLYGERHAVSPALHAVDRARLLFGAALGYSPDLARLDAGIAPAMPATDAGARRAFLLHGTTWRSKAWPLGQWIALARGLVARGYRPALTFAGPAEEKLARAVAAAVPGTEILGGRRLAELAALIGDSALVVGVDTGLTHLAAALGRPTVGLFASTPAGQTAPRGPRTALLTATTPCAPCSLRHCPLVPRGTDPPCHATIGPERVLAQIDGWAG